MSATPQVGAPSAAMFRGGDIAVMEGRDGWLFLTEFEGIDALGAYVDPTTVPEEACRRWADILQRRREHFAGTDQTYVSLVVPDSYVVYPDKLPLGIVPSARPPFERITQLLDDPSRDQCVYPLDELIAGRAERDTFQQTDSHWTDWGAYLGYRATIERIARDREDVDVLEPERLTWTTRRSFGALGAAATPERSEVLTVASVVDDRTRRVVDVATHVRDAYLVLEQDRPDLPTAVIFRDSAMTAAARFFAQSFRRTVFCTSSNAVFFDLLDRERPDVVIHEFGERRIVNVPTEPSVRDFRETFGDLLLDDQGALAAERRVRTFLDAGRYDEALDAGDDVLSAAGPTARLMLVRSRVYEGLGDDAAALESLCHASLLDPSDAAPHAARGEILCRNDRVGEAVAAFRAAVSLEPRQRARWSRAVTAALQAGDVQSAADTAAAAVEHWPADAPLWHANACVHTESGDLARAESAARRACALDPSCELYRLQLATILVQRESWAAAENLLAALDAERPGVPPIVSGLAFVRSRLAVSNHPNEGVSP